MKPDHSNPVHVHVDELRYQLTQQQYAGVKLLNHQRGERRRRWRSLEVVCAGCGSVLAEKWAMEPTPVLTWHDDVVGFSALSLPGPDVAGQVTGGIEPLCRCNRHWLDLEPLRSLVGKVVVQPQSVTRTSAAHREVVDILGEHAQVDDTLTDREFPGT